MRRHPITTLRATAAVLTAAAALALAACNDETKPAEEEETPTGDVCETGQAICEISQGIVADTTWTKEHTYVLKGNIFVKNAVLTIQPGTVIKGGKDTSLAITPSARLEAVGTAAEPIVFTSNVAAGSRSAGDWGGLVLLGKAPINVQGGADNIEGYPEGPDTTYGGADAAHSCGTLKYARIEFAGYRLGGNNELNGLTLGGCGTGTTIDYVQVHRGLDDGVEMFGGTANLKHVVITLPDDDGLDWDQGWSGKAQFVIVRQNRSLGNHGIEADNSSSSPNATPRSAPTLWNVSLIGTDNVKAGAAQTQGGMILRVGSAGAINNAIVAYFNDFAVDIAGADSIGEVNAGRLTIKTTTFFNSKTPYGPDNFGVKAANDPADFNEWEKLGPGVADLSNKVEDPKLKGALWKANTTPSFKPEAVLAGAAPPADGFFDASATFRGAVGETDWLAGWTYFADN